MKSSSAYFNIQFFKELICVEAKKSPEYFRFVQFTI